MPAIECLTPECRERATHKGLCMKCYSEAKKLVEVGKTTWAELAILGLADIASNSKFSQALQKKRQERNS